MFEPARRVFLAFSLAVATLVVADFGAATQASAYITTEAKYAAIVTDANLVQLRFAIPGLP